MNLSGNIKKKAIELGFDLAGITDAAPINPEHVEYLRDWLKAGYYGQMDYMHRNFTKRINPAKLLTGAKSVIVVGLNYKPDIEQKDSPPTKKSLYRIAQYACYQDYHTFMKKLLRQLVDYISSLAGNDVKFKICVDSAPLAERAIAQRAGLGFIGKNHMLINPVLGPQIFLGEILTTMKLKPDKTEFCHSEQSEESHYRLCEDCNKCIQACPTAALRSDGKFDANKCISYLTIEHKGKIPSQLADKIGNRLFGCDECVLACPYQQKAPPCRNKQFKFYKNRNTVDTQRILDITEEQFKAELADSPISRTDLERLKRNIRITR